MKLLLTRLLEKKYSHLDIPFEKVDVYRKNIERNHYQTLERIIQRGGLSPYELVAAIQNKKFRDVWDEMTEEQAILKIIEVFNL